MHDKYFARLGINCIVESPVTLGLKYSEKCKKAEIGSNAVIRAFTVIYGDTAFGDDLKTGHFVTIREHTRGGDRVVVGGGTVIEGYVRIGSRVKIESNVCIPSHTIIGNDVFIGPGVVMTNDKYPQKQRDQYRPEGPRVEDNVSVGANVTILPGVLIETGSFIAAGSVVTKNVPPFSLVKGVPGKIYPLPDKLREKNRAAEC